MKRFCSQLMMSLRDVDGRQRVRFLSVHELCKRLSSGHRRRARIMLPVFLDKFSKSKCQAPSTETFPCPQMIVKSRTLRTKLRTGLSPISNARSARRRRAKTWMKRYGRPFQPAIQFHRLFLRKCPTSEVKVLSYFADARCRQCDRRRRPPPMGFVTVPPVDDAA